ncbi:hypothetical protein SteCoe_2810 [Stentor coeruleus]|uniref:Tyrosine-protein kinase ephrin type A/B receptor-like domain-containing protein n=1 Tax=Stentor coeruleus TaxID=5963 RepID=A0A1R2CYI0_9CILI|nr:hypothetical protein SteCoe_2810 [Stentor coeruleus]
MFPALYMVFILNYFQALSNQIIWPNDIVSPSISGIRIISVQSSDNLMHFIFSGSIDAAKFSSNMMIKTPYTIAFSSTSYYPSDRSYYGMAYSVKTSADYTYTLAIIFGGIGSNGVFGDFWAYYIDQDAWEKFELTLPEPSYDFAYTSIYNPDTKKTNIFVVGGIDNMGKYVTNLYKCIIEENSCLFINDFVNCTKAGLVGAEMIYSNNMLYLFAGYYFSQSSIFLNNRLCVLDLSIENSQWVEMSIKPSFHGYTHGGSCLYENAIYYFFGSSVNKSGTVYSEKIYKLDLENIDKGWEDTKFKCPDQVVCSRDSFGISCNDNIATIIGGITEFGSTNSYLYINMKNLNATDFRKHADYPYSRAFASLTQSSTKILLFGGINRGTIFNEVWEYEFIGKNELGTWKLLSILGSAPEPRFGHSAVAQGVFTIYIGGQTYEDRILSDIWMLNTVSNAWIELIPSDTSEYKIPALTRTCAMLDLPKLYFIGGRGYSGSNFDLWEYDLSTNHLLLLRKTQASDIGTFGHACQLVKAYRKVLIYTFYGMKNTLNSLYCGIREIDITDKNNIGFRVLLNNPLSFQCRGNFGYSYDGKYMAIIGGEIYPDFAMNDMMWIEFLYNYTEYTLFSKDDKQDLLYESLSGLSIISFADYVLIFSGYHDGGFSINSDLSSSLYAISFTGSNHCSAGFYKNNGECKPCQEGTYSPADSDFCIQCPLGTINYLKAASHISQCIPCSENSYYDINTKKCVDCPEGFLCPVGAQEPLYPNDVVIKEQQIQPLNFDEPSVGYSVIILMSLFCFTIIAFIVLFCSNLFIKVAFSTYDFFRSNHITIIDDDKYEEEKYKIRNIGGLLTGLVIIIYVYNMSFLMLNYKFGNEKEIRSLIPISSLLQEQNYVNNNLKLEISMYSYRGDCLKASKSTSDTFVVKSIKEHEKLIGKNSTLCTHTISVKFNKLFETEASIEIEFLSYTSDIALTVSGDSGNPGAISSVTQVIRLTNGDVLIGSEPNVFTISLIPAFYSYKDYFGDPDESLGFRLSPYDSPSISTSEGVENIYLSTGFKVKARLVVSEFGITTFRFQ